MENEKIDENENENDEMINVYCDVCDDTAYDTKENLELAGWQIKTYSTLCSLDRYD